MTFEKLTELDYEKMAEEICCTVEEVKRGYSFYDIGGGVEVVQIIGDLQGTEFEKFDCDLEAGKQALKDGFNVKHEIVDEDDLLGWYVLQK